MRTEYVEIAKIKMSGRCNHAGVETHKNTHTHTHTHTHTREWAEKPKNVEKIRDVLMKTRVLAIDTHVTLWVGKPV